MCFSLKLVFGISETVVVCTVCCATSTLWQKGMTQDQVVGRHHQLNGHEFEQAPGESEGQESLACCSPWGCKEPNTT